MHNTNSVDADQAMEVIRNMLSREGKLPPGTVVTRAIGIIQTLTENPDGSQHWAIHRLHPLGSTDPSSERGLLRDALLDADAQRRRPAC